MRKSPVWILVFLPLLGAMALPAWPGDPPFQRSTRSASLPHWKGGVQAHCENGYFAALAGVIKARREPGEKPHVVVYDRNGVLEHDDEIVVADAVDVQAYDVSVSRQGLVAVSAAAIRADGAVANLILLFEKPGPPTRLIRINPFYARLLALSPDGAIWAFGRDVEAERRNQNYAVFQKYDLDGHLLGKFVMRSTFPGGDEPSDHQGKGGGISFLLASKAGMAAYASAYGEWIELDNSGNVLGRWKAKFPDGAAEAHALRAAFTDSGGAYMQFLMESAGQAATCRLDRRAGVWQPLHAYRPGTESPSVRSLVGADGNRLVFRAADSHMYWFDEPN